MRDITLGVTFFHFFTTRQFSDGVPTVLADTPVLSVLEENNATPITAGVSVQVDRASVVGLNQATIVATGANGYEAGKSYAIYISTGTVGGVSVVGEVVGEFTVGQSAAAVDLANATDGLTALRTLLLGIATVAEFNARTILSASYFDPATDTVVNVTTVATLTGHTAQTADHTAGIADIPTVSEFNARTLVAASYFDPATDTVVTVTTTTNLTTNNDKTGYDLSAAGVNAVADAILPETNVALSNIPFLFVAASDGKTPVTGATTITGTRSIDGGAFVSVSGTITEIANGMYQFDALAADMNGGKIIFRFAATGGTPGAPDDRFVVVTTRSGV